MTPCRPGRSLHPLSVRLLAMMACLATTFPSLGQDTPQRDATDSAAMALAPLLRQVRTAKTTRASVVLAAETVVDGAIIRSQKSTYQVASKSPDQFTVYLKNDEQRSRIFCDGNETAIAFSPSAYTDGIAPIPLQQAVFDLPISLGPYPEAVLSLTLAGINPDATWIDGMKSIRMAGSEKLRGEIPSVRLEGVQEDLVRWDLWMTPGDSPKPLRLRVDLTDMLRSNDDVQLPKGYRYMLRFDFEYWAVNQPLGDEFFRFQAKASMNRYDSVEAYAEDQQGK